MELLNEKDAKYVVHHRVTEKKLLHLEKGVRKIGYMTGGNRIVTALGGLCIICLLVSVFFNGGAVAGAARIIGLLCALGVFLCLYSLWSGWHAVKKDIHIQFENGKRIEGNYDWEYRFYENCYEVIGKNEISHVLYSHIARLIELSGMIVVVENGNVVRYFMKEDVTVGDGDELAAFLEGKSKVKMEFVKVRD